MSAIVGETFDDYGNAPELLVESKAIQAWELLEECGLVRVFVCKTIQGRPVLDHTDLMTPDVMDKIGKHFQEIAAAARKRGGPPQSELENRQVH